MRNEIEDMWKSEANAYSNRLMRLSTVLFGVCGIIITFTLMEKAIDDGIASILCTISLTPYFVLIMLAQNTKSLALSVCLVIAAFGFTVGGNYVYFDRVMLSLSPSNGMFFLIVPAMEYVALIPLVVCFFVLRRKNEPAPNSLKSLAGE
jgi:hypothetical protein